MLTCFIVLLGHLCMTSEARVSFDGGSTVASFATIKPGSDVVEPAWSASALLHSDHDQAPNPKRLSQVCASGACVDYFVHCGADGACHLIVKAPDMIEPYAITLTGSLDTALSNLALLVKSNDTATAVPFTTFTFRSSFEDPYCFGSRENGRVIPDKDCR